MKLYQRITHLYDEDEAKAIVRLVLETRFGLSFADILCGKVNELSREDILSLEEIMCKLEKGIPVQYVLGEASFCGRSFLVAPGVLIPRPETEELCRWITDDNTKGSTNNILDIGSGSGCIAITLALDIPQTIVTSWDVSEKALNTARNNAERLKARVNFQKQDALAPPEDFKKWDIIVSNPPYITEREKSDMDENVLCHEPPLALFVPDSTPLLFYRSIAEYGKNALKENGCLYFEINSLYATETSNMLKELNFKDIETRKDIFGKDRMIKCRI